MLVALSSDDGVNLTTEHFGDGKKFYIYEVGPDGYKLVKTIDNNVREEKFHGDPEKAGSIGKLLGSEGVSVLVGFAMGPNIVRMRKRFVTVISRCRNMTDALSELVKNYGIVEAEATKTGEKEVLFLCQ